MAMADNDDKTAETPGIDSKESIPAKRKGGNPAWVKGCPSPNPGGRPHKRRETVQKLQTDGTVERCLEVLKEIRDDCPMMIGGEEGGPPAHVVGPSHRERADAAKTLLAYAIGGPTAMVELGGPDGGPVLMDLSGYTDEEVAILRKLRAQMDQKVDEPASEDPPPPESA